MIGWLQVAGVVLIVIGALLTLVTALGMVRLHSLFARMHASTKPQVLGLVVMCFGLAAVLQYPRATATLALVVSMQFVVAPISAHMLGRTVFRLDQVDRKVVVLDEFTEDLERAERQLDARQHAAPHRSADQQFRGRHSEGPSTEGTSSEGPSTEGTSTAGPSSEGTSTDQD